MPRIKLIGRKRIPYPVGDLSAKSWGKLGLRILKQGTFQRGPRGRTTGVRGFGTKRYGRRR